MRLAPPDMWGGRAEMKEDVAMKFDRKIAEKSDMSIYRDGDRRIKLFCKEYSKSDVLIEALNQARMEEVRVRVPKIFEVAEIDGQWAFASEFIEGKTLADLMEEHPEKKSEYMDLFVDLQIGVHAKSCPLLNKLKDQMSREIADTDLDATTRYDMHIRLEAMPKHNKVCHGDFTPANIVINEEGDAYILDWAKATQGNASADVANTYLLLCLSGDFELAELYLEAFCKKSDTPKRYVQKWLPMVAAAQTLNADDHERELLMKWVSIVDEQ